MNISQQMRAIIHHVRGFVLNRWMVVVATFFIMSCAGATYNFGVYSQAIKTSLAYNQETITTIGFFKDLGANVGVISGLIYDLTGPWVVLMLGSGLNLFGYLMIWLAVTKKLLNVKVWQICLYICIGANSQAFTNTGVVVTSVKNFPRNRGIVIGLLKGYVGLSGAMLTLLYQALYGDQPASFILLIGWLPCAVCLAFMFVIRRIPYEENKKEDETKIFYVFLAISLVLAAYLMVVIIVQHAGGLGQSANQGLAAFMLLIIISPLGIVGYSEYKKLRAKADLNKDVEDPKQSISAMPEPEAKEEKKTVQSEYEMNAKVHDGLPMKMEKEEEEKEQKSVIKSQNKCANLYRKVFYSSSGRWPARGEDFTIPQALISLDMWLIFLATTCGVGAGLMAIDNLGQLGASLGYSHSQTSTFVSLVSIWNFLGRVGSGFISEIFLQRKGVPRPFFFGVALVLAALGHLVIALNPPGALFAGSILIGMCFGAQWALMFTIISELFGLKYYGTLYNVGGVASPLGSYLLSVRVAGHLYDKEADKQHSSKIVHVLGRFLLAAAPALSPHAAASSSSSELLCYGVECYRTSFFIMAGVSLLGALIAFFLMMRTRKYYKEISNLVKLAKIESES